MWKGKSSYYSEISCATAKFSLTNFLSLFRLNLNNLKFLNKLGNRYAEGQITCHYINKIYLFFNFIFDESRK